MWRAFLKIKINTSLDWFENQIVDRGWNLGLNRNYKQAKSFGCGMFALTGPIIPFENFSLPSEY